tara:strand:+ start:3175 stop:3975 length:801 start_codon:yes stop_codon:yes gene_type:complete
MNFPTYITETKLAEATKKTHIKNFDILENIINEPVKVIIKSLDKNYNTRQIFQYNKTISKYLDFKNRPKDRVVLLDYAKKIKDSITTLQQKRTCTIKKDIENNDMKDKEQLMEALDNLYSEGAYLKFIINYLLLNFHTRNQDLDLTITNTNKEMNDETNYLLVRKNKVVFIRNNYKTKELYGVKEYVITDKKFIYAVKQLGLGKILHTNNISREVRSHTIDKLSESQINKIIMFSLPVNDLEHISQSRGTSINTLLESYNPNKICK